MIINTITILNIIINIAWLAEQVQSLLGSGEKYGVNIEYSHEKNVRSPVLWMLGQMLGCNIHNSQPRFKPCMVTTPVARPLLSPLGHKVRKIHRN